jgi:hypothetical protein
MLSSVAAALPAANAARKGILFGALYFAQTLPKGYLKFLPILMAEQGSSMKAISTVALLSLSDSFKPLYGVIFDSKRFSSVRARKAVIVSIQSLIILTFTVSLVAKLANKQQLAVLFAVSNALTSVHDTAIDGLAVQCLQPAEQTFGAFGQYTGYKLGTIVMGGILPAYIGTNHQVLCLGVIGIMALVMLYTISFDFSAAATVGPSATGSLQLLHHQQHEQNNITEIPIDLFSEDVLCKVTVSRSSNPKVNCGSTTPEPFVEYLRRTLYTLPGTVLVLMLLLYKAGDHGLDFVWGPLLVNSQISRKNIVKTQFIMGNLAGILGAMCGTALSSRIGDTVVALVLCSIARVGAGLMQLLFVCDKRWQTVSFLSAHAVWENVSGAAVTAVMFSYLLQHSDPLHPAASYALMNSIALFGMNAGEFVAARCSHSFGFPSAIGLGLAVNIAFPLVVLVQRYLERRHLSDISSRVVGGVGVDAGISLGAASTSKESCLACSREREEKDMSEVEKVF